MASERFRTWPFGARLVLRASLAGGLLVAGGLLGWSGKPVSASLAIILAIVAWLDMLRVARRAELAMSDLVEQLANGAEDLPPRLDPAFRGFDAAISRAVSARRSARQHQRAETNATQALLDTIPAALFVLAEDGGIVLANRAARRLAPDDLHDFSRHPAFGPSDAQMLAAAQPGSGRILRMRDGRAALAGVALFTLADGTRRRLISIQIVAEELSAVELHSWQHLSRVLAHEMMNSLSPVISLAESLSAMVADPSTAIDQNEIADSLQLMARRATHLMNFIERYRTILDMPEAVPAPVALAPFVADLAQIQRAAAPHVAIRTSVEPFDLVAAIDRELMEQALINLLKNAVEALGDVAEPRIELICRATGGDLTIEVVDNGPGLGSDPDILFMPFYSSKAGGSGIGLAVARQIAQAHGAMLTAESTCSGARFSIRLHRENAC